MDKKTRSQGQALRTGSSAGRASAGTAQNPHRHGPARDGIFDRGKIRAGHGQKNKTAGATATDGIFGGAGRGKSASAENWAEASTDRGQKTKTAGASAGTGQNPRGFFLMEWGVGY